MDTPKSDKLSVVYTDKAQCRDCYRCVRSCPVKAIGMENSQAAVAADLCIACGTCVKQCPQSAKKYRHDLAIARELIASDAKVAASIAPSFAARLNPWQQQRIASMLRTLGFDWVGETAVGAWYVANETASYVRDNPGRAHISTACPALVSYIEKYHPDCAEYLVPIASPMIAHGRMLKQRMGDDTKVVFIGPCIAKKDEADRRQHAGVIDCVLTFEELDQWMQLENIDLQTLEESSFDESPAGKSRSFPLPGGALLTAGLSSDMLAIDTISVSGFDEVEQMVADLPNVKDTLLIEPLMCSQGCINGPAMACADNMFSRRRAALAYAGKNAGIDKADQLDSKIIADQPTDPDVKAAVDESQQFTEQQIQDVLAATGKTDLANQLNCGACGYDTCREKAIAVLRGLAESEMCIPYMRRLAERRTDRIIETSPNGIVILDKRLNIISMNPAFRDMFRCGDAICGRHISYLMDAGPFEQAAAADKGANDKHSARRVIERVVRHESYSLVCHQVVYALDEDQQYVGIFVNITRLKDNQRQLDDLRSQTIAHARQLHEQQVDMARRIAEFLGQSTARGERLLEDLMDLSRSEQDSHRYDQ